MGLISDLLRGPTTADRLNEAKLEQADFEFKRLKEEAKLKDRQQKIAQSRFKELGVDGADDITKLSTLMESLVDPDKYRQPTGAPAPTASNVGALPNVAINQPGGSPFFAEPTRAVPTAERGPVDPDLLKMVAEKQMLGLKPQAPKAPQPRKTRFISGVTGELPDTKGQKVVREVYMDTGETATEVPMFDPGQDVKVTDPSGEEATYRIVDNKVVPGSKLQTKPPTLERLATEPELTSHRHKDTGEVAPIGTTKQELADNYTRLTPPKPASGATKAAAALQIVDQLDKMVVQLFPEEQTGFLGRAKAGIANTWNQFTQANPLVAEYEAMRMGTSSLIIKALGEAGTLSEGDNARALNLTAKVWPIPDSNPVAMGKMRNLRELLTNLSEAGLTGTELTTAQKVRADKLIRDAMKEADRLDAAAAKTGGGEDELGLGTAKPGDDPLGMR